MSEQIKPQTTNRTSNDEPHTSNTEPVARKRTVAPEGFTRVRLDLEYDGTDFVGWQKQPGGLPTVQGQIENALTRLFNDGPITIIGAGRTDQGVHARGQVAHFDVKADVERYQIVHAMQGILQNKAIVVKSAQVATPSFHCQFDAVSKTYCYRIVNSPTPSALESRYSIWVSKPLDLDFLNDQAQALVGTHDFESFRSQGTFVTSTVRTVNWVKFERFGDVVEFRINGSGFLKQMVRNIVGTLLDLVWERRPPGTLKELIAARDRKLAGMAVPPQGLFLEKVYYLTETADKQ